MHLLRTRTTTEVGVMADEAIAQRPSSHLTNSVGNRFFTNPTAIRCSCAGIVQANTALGALLRHDALDAIALITDCTIAIRVAGTFHAEILRAHAWAIVTRLVTTVGCLNAGDTLVIEADPGRTIGVFSTLHVLTGTFITNLSVSTGCIIFAEEFTCIIATDIRVGAVYIIGAARGCCRIITRPPNARQDVFAARATAKA